MEREFEKNEEDKKMAQVLMTLSGMNPMFSQLLQVSNGSKSMTEQAGSLMEIYKKMGELTVGYKGMLSAAQPDLEVEQLSQAYDDEMLKCFRILIPTLQTLKGTAFEKGLPRQILGPIVVSTRQIENNMGNIMQIVDKQNARGGFGPNNQSLAANSVMVESELRGVYANPGDRNLIDGFGSSSIPLEFANPAEEHEIIDPTKDKPKSI